MSAREPLIARPGVAARSARGASIEDTVRALMPDLLAYFVRRLEDREDAADCLSEVLLVVWRKERALPDDDEGRRRYAYGVARRVLTGARRRRIRRREASDRLYLELIDTPAPDPVDLDLRAALAALPERDRELVLLVAWDGFGVGEAGAVLGLRPDAARARYSRARARLRGALADDGHVPREVVGNSGMNG